MRPDTAYPTHLLDYHQFTDDDMSLYSINSLLGDVKKAEFRQRTDSSAAKIKEIMEEIRVDVDVMEKRASLSRETTPTLAAVAAADSSQELQQLQQPAAAAAPDQEEEGERDAVVMPDPEQQRVQAARNLALARRFSPALKFKAALVDQEKREKKTITRRKFSLVHSLPERASAKRDYYVSSPPAHSMARLLAASPPGHHHHQHQHHHQQQLQPLQLPHLHHQHQHQHHHYELAHPIDRLIAPTAYPTSPPTVAPTAFSPHHH